MAKSAITKTAEKELIKSAGKSPRKRVEVVKKTSSNEQQSGSSPSTRRKQAKPTDKKTAILVLGMHRSGTSAVTRTVSMLGCQLPKNLMGSGEGNEAGHWESDKLVAYNENLLKDLSLTWDTWQRADLKKFSITQREQIRQDITQIIKEDYGDAKTPLIKDPRVSLYADFFIDILEASGYEVRCIHVVRNPLDVIDSLIARKSFWSADQGPIEAALIWLRHTIDAEQKTRDKKRIHCSFERFMEDPQSEILRVERAFPDVFPLQSEQLHGELTEFVKPNLRHHARSESEVLYNTDVIRWVSEVFAALLDIVKERNVENAQIAIDKVAEQFDAVSDVLLRMQQAQRILSAEARSAIEAKNELSSALEGKEAAYKSELERLQKEASNADRLVKQTQKSSVQKDAEIQQIRAEFAALLKSFEEAQDHIAKSQRAHQEKDDALRARASDITRLNDTVSKLKDALNQSNEERENVIKSFSNSTSWKVTVPLRVMRTPRPYIGKILERPRRVRETLSSAVAVSGGVGNAVRKGTRVLRREGLSGVKTALYWRMP